MHVLLDRHVDVARALALLLHVGHHLVLDHLLVNLRQVDLLERCVVDVGIEEFLGDGVVHLASEDRVLALLVRLQVQRLVLVLNRGVRAVTQQAAGELRTATCPPAYQLLLGLVFKTHEIRVLVEDLVPRVRGDLLDQLGPWPAVEVGRLGRGVAVPHPDQPALQLLCEVFDLALDSLVLVVDLARALQL